MKKISLILIISLSSIIANAQRTNFIAEKLVVLPGGFLSWVNFQYGQGFVVYNSTDSNIYKCDGPMSTNRLLSIKDTSLMKQYGGGNVSDSLVAKRGQATFSSTGLLTQYIIPHGLGSTPVYANVGIGSSDAQGITYWTVDGTNIYVNYSSGQPIGTNNIKLWWEVHK